MRFNDEASLKTPLPVYLFACFVAFTPITVFFSQYFGWSYHVLIGDPWLPMSGWLLIGSLLFVAYLVSSSQVRLSSSPLFVPLLILIIWAGLSGFWAHNSYLVFIKWLYWAASLLGFIYVTNIFRDRFSIALLMQSLLVSGGLVACLGLLQYYIDIDWVFQSRPPAAVFGNKNMAAQYCLLTLPLAYALLAVGKGFLARLLILISTVLIIWFIVLAASRAVLLAAGVMAFTLTLYKVLSFIRLNQPTILPKLAFSLLVLICGVLFWIVYQANLQSLLSEDLVSGQDGFSIKLRLVKWLNAWELYKNHWLLGVGLNNWVVEYPKYHQAIGVDSGVSLSVISEHSHNDYLQYVVELGVVGLGALIYFISKLYCLLRINVKAIDDKYVVYREAIVLALLGISVVALFSFPGQLPHSIYLVVVYLGLLSAMASNTGLRAVNSVVHSNNSYVLTRYQIIIISALLLLTAAVIKLNFNFYTADIWYRKAHQYYFAKDHSAAKNAADIAVKYNPYRYETLKYRAVTYDSTLDPLAEHMMLEVLRLYPNSLNSLKRIFDFHLQKKQYMKALSVAIKIENIAPKSDYSYENLALVYRRLNNKKGFAISVRKLNEINPHHPLVKSVYSRYR